MRRIAVFTGTRADYGLLFWLMREIESHQELDLRLIVGAMHLSPGFGNTVEQIESDGFSISERVEMLLASDTPIAITKSVGLGTISFAEVLDRQKPDILVVLGDRFEALSIVQAALFHRVPVAHLHGGERTEGLIDEGVRHAITKMSHLHFTSTEAYRRRVINMGEQPRHVFNFGALGVEQFLRMDFMSRDDLETDLGFELGESFFLVTYHPVTLTSGGDSEAFINLIKALESQRDAKIIITYPNADTFGANLVAIIESFKARLGTRVLASQSLGQYRYLSLMKLCSAVIGNSSSGIIEAPSAGVPTVNIGDRQLGRIQANSIVNCDGSYDQIAAAIAHATSDEFRMRARSVVNPNGSGETAHRIVSVLAGVDLNGIIKKSFHDIEPVK